MEDPELLDLFVRHGSENAFTTLVNRYANLVYSAALRQVGGDVHLARDVSQVVFTDLARKAAKLRERSVLTGWLYTSTRFAAIQIMRSEGRRLRRETEAHTMNESSIQDTSPVWTHINTIIDEVMHELRDDEREVVLLRYFEGRPYAEIGRRLSVPENTARMRVDRALDKMHGLLARRGVTSTAAALGAVISAQGVGAAPAGFESELAHAALTAGPVSGALILGMTGRVARLAWWTGLGAACVVWLIFEARGNLGLRHENAALLKQNAAVAAALVNDKAELARNSITNDARRRFLDLITDVAPDDPAGQTLAHRRLVLRTRATILPKYAPLLRALKLPTETRIKFEALLLQKTVAEVTALVRLAREAEDKPSSLDATCVALVKAAVSQRTNEQIEALLGREAYGNYVAYARVLPIRLQVNEVAVASPDIDGASLREEQIVRLVEFVARTGGDPAQPLPDTILREAASLLDQGEQAALARLQTLRIARRQIIKSNQEAAASGLISLLPLHGFELDELKLPGT